MDLNTYTFTCAIHDLKDNAITFAKDFKYLLPALSTIKRVLIMIPFEMDLSGVDIPLNITLYRVEYLDYEFTILHNKINSGVSPADNIYGDGVFIHPSAVIYEGVRVANMPNGGKLQLKHMGNVKFGNRVRVGALTLIERGCLASTIIGDGVQIDGRVTIGHNSIIGANTVIATGAVIGGSAKIGKNCWIGLNSTVLNGKSVCDNVVVGAGGVVIRDIVEPGIYAGVPAIFKKKYDSGYNF